MANPEHVKIVRQGARAILEWRRHNKGVKLDLSRAKLSGAKLSGANLSRANLTGANLAAANLTKAYLTEANLTGANLFHANLTLAYLARANLTLAYLIWADLTWADLRGADLAEADLAEANLRGVNLTGADLAEARLALTSMGDCDLSQAKGLSAVDHNAPSSIGVDTLIASFRGAGNVLAPELERFFLGAGVPKELLEALPGILAKVLYYSCFIAYGQPDVEFAKRLYGDLKSRGVSCWLYDLDKTPGQPTWGEIEQKLGEYEKMLVLCSIDALMRDGVKKEIDKQIDKSPEKLMPLSLESRWMQAGFTCKWGNRDLKTWLLERNYADFAKLLYEEALQRLLKALERRRP